MILENHPIKISFKKKFGQRGFTLIIEKTSESEPTIIENVTFKDTIDVEYDCGYKKIVEYVDRMDGFNSHHLLGLLLHNAKQ